MVHMFHFAALLLLPIMMSEGNSTGNFSKLKLSNVPRKSESTIHVLSTAYQIMTMAYCSLFHFKYPNVYIVV